MKGNILILLCLSIPLVLPNLASSDCTDFGRVTGWYVQDDKNIIFYARNSPIAKVVLQDCKVNVSSNIRFLKTYMCDGDRLLIDGEECSIMDLVSASAGSF
jgi:hypothetical protein